MYRYAIGKHHSAYGNICQCYRQQSFLFRTVNGSVNLTVSGGTAGYTFVWNNSATTQNLSNVAAGTYQVTVTDTKGCSATGSANLSQASVLNISATNSAIACFGGNNGAINLSVSGGSSPYTFSWGAGVTTQTELICLPVIIRSRSPMPVLVLLLSVPPLLSLFQVSILLLCPSPLLVLVPVPVVLASLLPVELLLILITGEEVLLLPPEPISPQEVIALPSPISTVVPLLKLLV
ncbi:MAG: SprB repeat-containing protein [Bacteroidetes bacterium]|nr:SprB repeat-containing protein [Bacteroidota bacterium]